MFDETPTTPDPAALRRQSAFTLVELLVVVAAIGILAVLTTLGARRLTQGTRLASATNSVVNALSSARAAAIRDGEVTAVIFRPVWDPNKKFIPQRVEIVVARSTGDRYDFTSDQDTRPYLSISERYRPVERETVVTLAEGIKVAALMYNWGTTFSWSCSGTTYYPEQVYGTQAELPTVFNCVETIEFGRMVAVLFGPNGQLLTRSPRSSLGDQAAYCDWNNDGQGAALDFDPQTVIHSGGNNCGQNNFENYWLQDDYRDESNLMFVTSLTIYDDKAAREAAGTLATDCDFIQKIVGPQGYIAQFGERIAFNRFSGLPERKGR
jgi:prepilin-type N-terminal cleavage/methylation domain-containing protein